MRSVFAGALGGTDVEETTCRWLGAGAGVAVLEDVQEARNWAEIHKRTNPWFNSFLADRPTGGNLSWTIKYLLSSGTSLLINFQAV
jgi:hypothetical protein